MSVDGGLYDFTEFIFLHSCVYSNPVVVRLLRAQRWGKPKFTGVTEVAGQSTLCNTIIIHNYMVAEGHLSVVRCQCVHKAHCQ